MEPRQAMMHLTPISGIDPVGDPRLSTALQLAAACDYEVDHSHQVTRLALCLFDQLRETGGYGDEDRFTLNAAALLHDIGWIEGRRAHHKTAMRLILESPVLDLDPSMRLIVGLIARYHRKALPDAARHQRFASLDDADQGTVCLLAGILRTADGLDGSHRNVVNALRVDADKAQVRITCGVTGDGTWEQGRAESKGDLLAATLNRRLTVQCMPG